MKQKFGQKGAKKKHNVKPRYIDWSTENLKFMLAALRASPLASEPVNGETLFRRRDGKA